MQALLTASESIAAKQRYECAMLSLGVTVVAYQTDNGFFAADAFVQELHSYFQTAGYSGAGAPHQNGVAERNIVTIMSMARALMLHAAVRTSPKALSGLLWLSTTQSTSSSGSLALAVPSLPSPWRYRRSFDDWFTTVVSGNEE
jgi:hypothetical protein